LAVPPAQPPPPPALSKVQNNEDVPLDQAFQLFIETTEVHHTPPDHTVTDSVADRDEAKNIALDTAPPPPPPPPQAKAHEVLSALPDQPPPPAPIHITSTNFTFVGFVHVPLAVNI
jgi:hypothetical protein